MQSNEWYPETGVAWALGAKLVVATLPVEAAHI